MKPFLKKTTSIVMSDRGKDLGLLILRLFFAAMMISHGAAKVSNFISLTETFPDPVGMGSYISLVIIITIEIGASVFLMAGFLTRLAALVLAFSMCVAAFIVHTPFSFTGSELPLVYLIVYISLIASGSGKYSIDHLLKTRYINKLN